MVIARSTNGLFEKLIQHFDRKSGGLRANGKIKRRMVLGKWVMRIWVKLDYVEQLPSRFEYDNVLLPVPVKDT